MGAVRENVLCWNCGEVLFGLPPVWAGPQEVPKSSSCDYCGQTNLIDEHHNTRGPLTKRERRIAALWALLRWAMVLPSAIFFGLVSYIVLAWIAPNVPFFESEIIHAMLWMAVPFVTSGSMVVVGGMVAPSHHQTVGTVIAAGLILWVGVGVGQHLSQMYWLSWVVIVLRSLGALIACLSGWYRPSVYQASTWQS